MKFNIKEWQNSYLTEDKNQVNKWAKQVQSETGYKTKIDGKGVYIPEGPSANRDYDGDMAWGWTPGEGAWTETGAGAYSYKDKIDNIDDFIDLVNNPNKTMGKWN